MTGCWRSAERVEDGRTLDPIHLERRYFCLLTSSFSLVQRILRSPLRTGLDHSGLAKVLYLFEDFALDAERRELRRGALAVAVEPQVFDLLHYLIQHRDHVVSRDDLLAFVWGGRIVSELCPQHSHQRCQSRA